MTKRKTAKKKILKKEIKKAKKLKKMKRAKVAKKKTVKKVKRIKASKTKKVKKVKTAQPLAKVIHYYDRIGVAIVAVNKALNVGEKVTFQKGADAFTQCISSMQMEHESIAKAQKGAEVGVKVEKPVKEGTLVLPAV